MLVFASCETDLPRASPVLIECEPRPNPVFKQDPFRKPVSTSDRFRQPAFWDRALVAVQMPYLASNTRPSQVQISTHIRIF
jgi:hypothetical protein